MNKTTLCFIHKYTDLKQKSLIHTRKPIVQIARHTALANRKTEKLKFDT